MGTHLLLDVVEFLLGRYGKPFIKTLLSLLIIAKSIIRYTEPHDWKTYGQIETECNTDQRSVN